MKFTNVMTPASDATRLDRLERAVTELQLMMMMLVCMLAQDPSLRDEVVEKVLEIAEPQFTEPQFTVTKRWESGATTYEKVIATGTSPEELEQIISSLKERLAR